MSGLNRYICIHGHFYQPPRENPWLEAIEEQESASPYHDWNERICAECYLPNGAARLLDSRGFIRAICNNYASMSFNFGPTLLSWMEQFVPEAYASVIEADTMSAVRFGGHGSAMAQIYNHVIMPLANERDKITQVRWGIEDFRMRFRRYPEGMWLSECAVDIATLEVLAAENIKFTVLSPHQAKGVRSLWQDTDWMDVSGAKIDTRVPYLIHLPSGRMISVFFYDHTISQAVAFEGLLNDGRMFAERLLKRSESGDFPDKPQLVSIATDGESYGHHHRFGEMALAFALDYVEQSGRARLTNYGEFLEKFPPTMEVMLIEPSSWSCCHGVGRWMEDCGCKIGSPANWTQEWRRPLRDALNWLRDEAAGLYEQAGRELMPRPWEARDAYIHVINDVTDLGIESFLRSYAPCVTVDQDRVQLLRLLEMQRSSQLMFTSCGWFFDDLSGIETIQLMSYAGRVIDLFRKLSGRDLEGEFLRLLEKAKSNIPEEGTGASLYARHIPGFTYLFGRVIAQVCIMELFNPGFRSRDTHAFHVELEDAYRTEIMYVGNAKVSSKITQASGDAQFVLIGKNDFNVMCAIRPAEDGELKNLVIQFQDLTEDEARVEIENHFESGHVFTLASLMPEALRFALNTLAQNQREELRAVLFAEFEKHKALLLKLTEFKLPLPEHLRQLAEFAVNDMLRGEILNPTATDAQVEALMAWVESGKIRVNFDELAYLMRQRLIDVCDAWSRIPGDPQLLKNFLHELLWSVRLPVAVDRSHVQNVFWRLKQQTYGKMNENMRADMRQAGELLKVHVE